MAFVVGALGIALIGLLATVGFPAVIERDDERLINGYWNAVQAFTNSSYPDADSLAVRKILKEKITKEAIEKMTKGI